MIARDRERLVTRSDVRAALSGSRERHRQIVGERVVFAQQASATPMRSAQAESCLRLAKSDRDSWSQRRPASPLWMPRRA